MLWKPAEMSVAVHVCTTPSFTHPATYWVNNSLSVSRPDLCIFSSLVQSESGCANIVSAAPCQAEPQQYEVQFGRLRNFLTGKYSALEPFLIKKTE